MPMSLRSIVLLSATPPTVNVVGDPVRVDSWYSSATHPMSAQIVAVNFKGRVYLDASLKVNPGDSDWFSIQLNGKPYVEYSHYHLSNTTDTSGYTFTGRFVWMRARIVRDYFLQPNTHAGRIAYYGQIDRILLNI